MICAIEIPLSLLPYAAFRAEPVLLLRSKRKLGASVIEKPGCSRAYAPQNLVC